MIIVPKPKILNIKKGKFRFNSKGYLFVSTKNLFTSAERLKKLLNKFGVEIVISYYRDKKSTIFAEVNRNKVRKKSGYKLIISPSFIKIYGNNNHGLHYGLMTLIQLIKNHGIELPSMEIYDWPDIENRGLLLDISRDKVPKLETIFKIVDMLSELKYNQLQFYTEHTFAYRDHEKVWKDYSPLTSEDIIRIDKYCKERFIELVPNQASFGHMEKWLSHEEYSYMAETYEFDTPWGTHFDKPFTLSPAVEDSIRFLDSLYKELLPNFRSKLFNVNCDETFDLCLGKSKKLCEKHGKGKVYLDFVLKIYKLVKKYGKRMMMWGDIIRNYPDLISELPEDVILLSWGYEKDHPFEKECKLFSPFDFYVCPGTSSWNSILGRVENSILNIQNAIENGLKFGAKGFLLTDWGDNGHWQHLPISYIGYVYGAAVSWGFKENKDIDIQSALDVLIFEEKSLGKILYEIGNAYKKTGIELPNSTFFVHPLLSPEIINISNKIVRKLKLENLLATKELLDNKLEFLRKLEKSNLNKLEKEEIKNSIELALFVTDLMISFLKTKSKSLSDLPKVIKQDFKYRFEKIVDDYKRLWLKRNRIGGLNESLKKLEKITKYFE
ncbi:MAG: hexosaminidase [Thermosipho sp. (in: thermotogales)]|nr:hexosaminidase [Thermosipho sp. (in: thermotogales)]MDN5324926.1 hexosaminidase [Thermosipho sp. (in: thermotogales)]